MPGAAAQALAAAGQCRVHQYTGRADRGCCAAVLHVLLLATLLLYQPLEGPKCMPGRCLLLPVPRLLPLLLHLAPPPPLHLHLHAPDFPVTTVLWPCGHVAMWP